MSAETGYHYGDLCLTKTQGQVKTGHRGFCLGYKRTLNVAFIDPLYPHMFTPRKLATMKLKRSIERKMSQKTTCWSRERESRGLEGESCEVENRILFHLK